jgi:hypothetical protein
LIDLFSGDNNASETCTKSMKKQGLALLTIPAVLFLYSCTSRTERTLQSLDQLLDSLKTVHAPDTRVQWWDIRVTNPDGEVQLEGSLADKEIYEAVTRSVEARFPEIRDELVLLPEEDAGRIVNGLVNNSVCHLRGAPSSKEELVTQSLLGTPVLILKESRGKVLVQLPDGYLGWTNASEVHALDTGEMAAYRKADKYVFTAQYGFSYSEPDISSLPVSDLVLGDILPVMGENGSFFEVTYPDGRTAWVRKTDVTGAGRIFLTPTDKEGLVHTALAYNGIPYLWGGTSAKNIDCSGFVSNIYYMNGIQLPRDADQQSYCGRVVTEVFEPDKLEQGDLLFFGRKAGEGKPESITHVGMYIGNGEFIHSSGWRDRVSINSMDSAQTSFIGSYPEIFVRATRILGEEPVGFEPVIENLFYKEIFDPEDE